MEAINCQNLEYKITSTSICLTKEELAFLKNETLVPGEDISLNLLNMILENDDFFEYALSVFGTPDKNFSLMLLGSDEKYYIPKISIYKAFKTAINTGLINLTNESLERFRLLKEMVSLDFYENCHKSEIYKLNIEGIDYEFKIKNFFELLKYEPLKFAYDLENKNELFGIKKEYFIYALKQYFLTNYLEASYEFSETAYNNYCAIKNNSYVDIRAINISYEKDPLLDEIILDEGFEEYILTGIPSSFNLLEKALYIYIKLCKVLIYDDEYYAANQRGQAALKHQSVSLLKNITLENNSIVCYEFCLIFNYFLYKLGLLAKINYLDGQYGNGHAYVEFRYDKFIICADSTVSILYGDLFHAKLNKAINGLICKNRNSNTKNEFMNVLDKVYDYIAKEETEYSNIYEFEDILSAYLHLTENYEQIPFQTRLDLFLEKIKSTTYLKGLNMLSYIKIICANFFSPNELKNKVSFNIIANHGLENPDKVAEAVGVLCINENGFSDNHYENYYYVYTNDFGLEPISYFIIKDRFNRLEYKYIEQKNIKEIPGIKKVENRKVL